MGGFKRYGFQLVITRILSRRSAGPRPGAFAAAGGFTNDVDAGEGHETFDRPVAVLGRSKNLLWRWSWREALAITEETTTALFVALHHGVRRRDAGEIKFAQAHAAAGVEAVKFHRHAGEPFRCRGLHGGGKYQRQRRAACAARATATSVSPSR